MIESKKPPEANSPQSSLDQTVQSEFELTRGQKVEDPFDTTVQSEFAATTQDDKVMKAINKLGVLEQTLKSNPKAVMNDSFISCSLSLSEDPVAFKKREHF